MDIDILQYLPYKRVWTYPYLIYVMIDEMSYQSYVCIIMDIHTANVRTNTPPIVVS